MDYLLALAIVFDDAESQLFSEIAEPFSRKLSKWDFHMSGFDSAISPLLLAARVGNRCAARYLTRKGASAGYKSYLDLIPLHFLFLFEDDYVTEMAGLLSAGLESADPYFARNTYIAEQLCSLVGTPLAFSVQVQHSPSIQAIKALQIRAGAPYTLEYQGGPATMLPGIHNPMRSWTSFGEVFDNLARLGTDVSEDLTPILDNNERALDISIMMVVVFRAWHLNSMLLWILHGTAFQTRLERTMQTISNAMMGSDIAGNVQALLPLSVPLLVLPKRVLRSRL